MDEDEKAEDREKAKAGIELLRREGRIKDFQLERQENPQNLETGNGISMNMKLMQSTSVHLIQILLKN